MNDLIKLDVHDFEYLYALLTAEVCSFDCGAICSLINDDVPVCCEQNHVVPILYKNEYKFLKSKTKLWKKFKPVTKHDRFLLNDCGYDEVMANCKGHMLCERNHRSLICRTFPFYPYIDKNNEFLGLTYNYDFDKKCTLVARPEVINPEYIRQSIDLWNYIFNKDEAEFDAHKEVSRKMEKNRRKCNECLHIFSIDGVKIYESSSNWKWRQRTCSL